MLRALLLGLGLLIAVAGITFAVGVYVQPLYALAIPIVVVVASGPLVKWGGGKIEWSALSVCALAAAVVTCADAMPRHDAARERYVGPLEGASKHPTAYRLELTDAHVETSLTIARSYEDKSRTCSVSALAPVVGPRFRREDPIEVWAVARTKVDQPCQDDTYSPPEWREAHGLGEMEPATEHAQKLIAEATRARGLVSAPGARVVLWMPNHVPSPPPVSTLAGRFAGVCAAWAVFFVAASLVRRARRSG